MTENYTGALFILWFTLSGLIGFSAFNHPEKIVSAAIFIIGSYVLVCLLTGAFNREDMRGRQLSKKSAAARKAIAARGGYTDPARNKLELKA